MSHKTPTRARSCYANSSTTTINSTPSRNSFRPPSRLSMIPKSSSPIQPPRSRPSSAMSISRPSTPLMKSQEPYTGAITVSIRPNPNTIDTKSWSIDEYDNSIMNTNDGTRFVFDNVFPMDRQLSNIQVYNKSCYNVVNKFLEEGYNGTIFAYGMTGSGKTFSMKGCDTDPGFVELAINDIFQKITDNATTKKYKMDISYLEIYNEKIIDLLSGSPSSPTTSQSNQDLKIRDDVDFGIKVVGLTSANITSKPQLLQLIKYGDTNRKTSATDFNARSSRSHSILQIRLQTIDLLSETELKSTLSLCDLAGSERAATSLERRKEGSFINKSLLALSNVINKLSSSTLEHIPYRDSKLTRLLQPALSGSSLVSILCTIHMGSNQQNSQQCVAETYKTLRFAARAKDIVINVERNMSQKLEGGDSSRMIQELNEIISKQRQEIIKLQSSTSASLKEFESSRIIQLESENRVLIEKLDHLNRLTDLQKTETAIIKNDILNDILASGLDSSQILMTNIEDFYKKMTYEANEYKSYIARLETQLKLESMSSSHQSSPTSSIPISHTANESSELMEALKEQEEEILMLKEQLKDKDQIIKSLSQTTRLRRLVDNSNNSTTTTNHHNTYNTLDNDFKRHTTIANFDKENYEPELRNFKLSPKKPKSNCDILESF
ncbi:kinesin-like protein, putative [Candida dubliniensis CD36]|uniref:Kinesin-like protein n=1 Tax=Candida dubliniensis (strain CD36 / ATCC MYA-646 / CBS 7987 / NCPF 3949 / NRRL Y-17841) TaxID=573826 RepID=B9WCU3_CANDC|nr:kinesin-like protein, putative [Candida dubliniensis CD36]CAX44217.1 kinesin-like protein, putative [Candida dubliniensis CD36]